MAKFCTKCGRPIEPPNTVCPYCSNNVKSSTKGIICGIVVVMILLGGYFAYTSFNKEIASNDIQATIEKGSEKVEKTIEKEPVNQIPKSESTVAVKKKTKYEFAQDEMLAHGNNAEVVATSYGHSSNGFLVYVFDEGGPQIFVIDHINGRYAEAGCDIPLRDLKTNSGPIVINFHIFRDAKDLDAKNGAWYDSVHMLPVYVMYSVDSSGRIVPKMMNTGEGAHPSHFHNHLQEKKNIDLVNLFLEEVPALLNDANAQGKKL